VLLNEFLLLSGKLNCNSTLSLTLFAACKVVVLVDLGKEQKLLASLSIW